MLHAHCSIAPTGLTTYRCRFCSDLNSLLLVFTAVNLYCLTLSRLFTFTAFHLYSFLLIQLFAFASFCPYRPALSVLIRVQALMPSLCQQPPDLGLQRLNRPRAYGKSLPRLG